jgi:hypothetical protein
MGPCVSGSGAGEISGPGPVRGMLRFPASILGFHGLPPIAAGVQQPLPQGLRGWLWISWSPPAVSSRARCRRPDVWRTAGSPRHLRTHPTLVPQQHHVGCRRPHHELVQRQTAHDLEDEQ